MGDEGTQKRADEILSILTTLTEVYTPEGVGIWLCNPHKGFGGDSALDLMRRGEVERVAQVAESLTGQVAT